MKNAKQTYTLEQGQAWSDSLEAKWEQELRQESLIMFWDEQCAQPLNMDRDDLPF